MLQNMIISYNKLYISSRLDHITSQQALQKQVRRPLLCCCKFYVAATGWARTVLTYASKTTTIVRQVSDVLTFSRAGRSHTRFNYSWRNSHPPATYVQITSVEPVSRKHTRNVGPGRFIQQYRRTKVWHAGKQYDLYRPQLTCVLLVHITSTHKT